MDEIGYLSFTARGRELSERLCAALGGKASCTRERPDLTLSRWTAENFPVRRALVYIGAAGIAVRAIAPHLRSKISDPAVIVVDERGQFVIPLVSGHLGGANDLARRIAALTGGTAVITTATDLNGVFAVDEWAKRHDCAVIPPSGIKKVSGKLLAGERVRIDSAFPIIGPPPDGVELWTRPTGNAESFKRPTNSAGWLERPTNSDGLSEAAPDVWLDVRRHPSLSIVPRVLVLGVGCRRGIARDTLERRFTAFCDQYQLWPEAFRAAATIDLKAHESGLLSFCDAHGWELHCFNAAELQSVAGTFTASAFVRRRTGTDNVCERAAVLCCQGTLLVGKYAGDGVTFAAAQGPASFDWNWQG